MERLSAHFRRAEFACKGVDCCGGSAPINPDLIDALEELRIAIGPIHINSGFRCLVHNRSPEVGSYDGSQHPRGNAADIASDGRSVYDMKAAAERAGLFVIMYPWGLHVDIRDTGK